METKCKDCASTDGVLSKEFNPDQSYSWSELADMTDVCVSCGSENIEYLDLKK